MSAPVKMIIEPAGGTPFERTYKGGELIVGRSSTSDLSLADPFLSRQHARIFEEGDRLLVEDLGSRNGTLVNGLVIDRPTPIQDGDVIKISGSTISLRSLDGDSRRPTTEMGATIFRPAAEMLSSIEAEARSSPDVDGTALSRYAERLELYREVHEALGRHLTLEELLDLILERAFRHLSPEEGVIFLRRGEEFERVATRCARGQEASLPLSRSLTEEVCVKGMAALVLDTETDDRFAGARSIILSGLRSLIAAPLMDSGGSLGMIVLGSKVAVKQFSEDDLELLVSLASVAALKIRNAALAEEAAQRRRMQEELELARRIQENLIPETLPSFDGYEIFARNDPSRGVSGDYYQVTDLKDRAVLLLVDVSGKGIPASLLTATIDALALGPVEGGDPPDELCAALSRRLYRKSPPEKFATAFACHLDLSSGELNYTNAGHNPALHVKNDGTTVELGPTGMPLGLVPTAPYTSANLTLEPGEFVVTYTDGITEAEDADEEEYGLERLEKVVLGARERSAAEVADAIDRDLEDFMKGATPHDDCTLVIIRRAPA